MSNWQSPEASARLKKRYAAERRFKALGLIAIVLSMSFLAVLLFTMLKNGISGLDWAFLSGSDSTDPANAGVWSAVKGSILTMLVTLALAFPMGVLAAIYLEEFAPRSRWVDWVEVSINNLAAVPSIIFGLLGLAVFIQVMHLPRSSPLVGGMTLALMTMPVIVIAGRNAIKAVPPPSAMRRWRLEQARYKRFSTMYCRSHFPSPTAHREAETAKAHRG